MSPSRHSGFDPARGCRSCSIFSAAGTREAGCHSHHDRVGAGHQVARVKADWAQRLQQQHEKIGDINEILVTQEGKISGVVIGVGGFLGMGEHDVMLTLDKVKFVNEPVRTSSTTTTTSGGPAGTATTTTTTRPARAANEKWYPDHAMVNATKDQLKAMPQFKYN